MLISTIDHSPYLGRLAIGRVERGAIRVADPIVLLAQRADDVIGFAPEEGDRQGKVCEALHFEGLQRAGSRTGARPVRSSRWPASRASKSAPPSPIRAPRAAGRYRRGRTDHFRRLRRQQLALRWARRQVRDQPAAARPPVQGARAQRRPARRRHRLARHIHCFRSRRIAPRYPHGDHAPRGLRIRRLTPPHHHSQRAANGDVLEPYEEVVIDIARTIRRCRHRKTGDSARSNARAEKHFHPRGRIRGADWFASSTRCRRAGCSATAASSSPTRAARACCTTASIGYGSLGRGHSYPRTRGTRLHGRRCVGRLFPLEPAGAWQSSSSDRAWMSTKE